MRRLVYLLAICLSFAARAELMWQRNNGAWEAVVRVGKEEPVYDIGDFRAVTNGYVVIPASTNSQLVVTAHVTWSTWSKNIGTTANYRPDTNGPYETSHTYNLAADAIDAYTNSLTEKHNFRAIDAVEWRTNTTVRVFPSAEVCGELPCRFGVPQTITVNPPYSDLLEMLPLDWPETYTRVRTGFDGYLLIRFEEDEMRLTIKRLLPELLPYEKTPRIHRDLLGGV